MTSFAPVSPRKGSPSDPAQGGEERLGPQPSCIVKMVLDFFRRDLPAVRVAVRFHSVALVGAADTCLRRLAAPIEPTSRQ